MKLIRTFSDRIEAASLSERLRKTAPSERFAELHPARVLRLLDREAEPIRPLDDERKHR